MTALSRLRDSFHGWGWAAPACAALLLAAAALHIAVSPAWRAQAQDAFSRATVLARPVGSHLTAQPPVQAIDSLEALPAATGLVTRLSALLAAAGHHNLRLGAADLSYPESDVESAVRWHVTMPVQGGYGDLRSFLQTSFAQDPSLSLERLRVSRTQADNTEIQAELVWVLHARIAGPKTP